MGSETVQGHKEMRRSRDIWAIALDDYETAMKAAGRSAGTIRLHRHYLSQLRAEHRSPWTVTTRDLRELMAAATWAPETRRSARATFRGFYRWAHGDGLLEHDPAASLPAIRVPAGIPRPTPEHLVERLLRHPDERIGLMVMLAAYGGLRASEIARVHSADLVGDELIVKGKGGRVRAVPIIDRRLAGRLLELEGWAFPNGLGSHLSPGHVTKLLSAQMPAGWTAHTLRHRFATVAYAGTRDLLAVGQVLGHSRPETTQRYVRIPGDAIRAAVSWACASA